MTHPAHLAGIARHAQPRGPIEVIERVAVSVDDGVAGNGRGKVLPGKPGRRQISLIEQESWDAALAELGLALPWHVRRANLLVSGVRLPREEGRIIAIGESLRLMVTCECDPCSRMDEIAPGLRAALLPDWRGGVLARVMAGGEIALGDAIRIEA
ncbi:MOSC domain-containing protein [Novosphingobium sp. Chol11]|uniref:MOSC domain-containing protein n=1 Tax=Novosphingobium sp. Chol11 TaxID=1385763 RepID=UPI0025D136BF|nr:MOSC domain-containing protein [Novosphingobium sp. Chol11]